MSKKEYEALKNFFIEPKRSFIVEKPPRDLYKEEKESKHDENLKTRKLTFCIIRCAIILTAFLSSAAIMILVWHILAPAHLRWLEENEIAKVQSAITYSLSGFFAGLLNKFSRILEGKKDS